MILNAALWSGLVLLAAIVGFAAHRAGICSVAAVEEILSTRRAFMLASFARTGLWVLGITVLLAWLSGTSLAAQGHALTVLTLAGGLFFGLGASLNGGCAFSTLRRLVDGDGGMLATLGGFVLGAVAISGVVVLMPITAATLAPTGLRMPSAWLLVITLSLLAWMGYEGWRLWRTRDRTVPLAAAIVERPYRLSTAALLMGVSNAVLYAAAGSWAYSTTVTQSATHWLRPDMPAPDAGRWLLLLAVVAGMAGSAWQGRSHRAAWQPRLRWLRHFTGGLLMGGGARLIPGGNDELILHGIPGLSPHAIPAFLAMLAGIAVSLFAAQALGTPVPRVNCGGDVCRPEKD